MSDLVSNPEDKFSRIASQVIDEDQTLLIEAHFSSCLNVGK